jgi:hypothetical protein
LTPEERVALDLAKLARPKRAGAIAEALRKAAKEERKALRAEISRLAPSKAIDQVDIGYANAITAVLNKFDARDAETKEGK